MPAPKIKSTLYRGNKVVSMTTSLLVHLLALTTIFSLTTENVLFRNYRRLETGQGS